jgi:uncharacterized OB-fold protein
MTYVLDAAMPAPVPMADGLDAPYWRGTRAHELRVQRCADCGTHRWSPEWICHVCHSFAIDWPAVEPHGVLFSFQRVWHPVTPALAGAVPYVNVLVELPHAGGIRMIGNYAGDPLDDLVIGAPMRAVFEDHDDAVLPYTLVQWKTA